MDCCDTEITFTIWEVFITLLYIWSLFKYKSNNKSKWVKIKKNDLTATLKTYQRNNSRSTERVTNTKII